MTGKATYSIYGISPSPLQPNFWKIWKICGCSRHGSRAFIYVVTVRHYQTPSWPLFLVFQQPWKTAPQMISNAIASDGRPQSRPPQSSSDGRGGEVVRLGWTLFHSAHQWFRMYPGWNPWHEWSSLQLHWSFMKILHVVSCDCTYLISLFIRKQWIDT